MTKTFDKNPTIDIKEIEESLFQKQIDSHQSNFANIRLHIIEGKIDEKRVRVRDDPSIENVLSLWGELEAIFSYVQSIVQTRPERKYTDDFTKNVITLSKMRREVLQYWNFYKLGICSKEVNPIVFDLRQSKPKDYKLFVQYRCIYLVNAFADKIRTTFQYLAYYFRYNKWKKNMGLEGDYITSKLDLIKSEIRRGKKHGRQKQEAEEF